jgi:hypothetical protein
MALVAVPVTTVITPAAVDVGSGMGSLLVVVVDLFV